MQTLEHPRLEVGARGAVHKEGTY